MAIITTGGGVASISGSVGGTTFSRNRGGPYMRTRAIPINPSTARQQTVRQFMSDLTSAWQSVLTQGQRDAWDLYAFNVPLPDALGNPRNVGGIGMYVRSNVPRLQAGLARIDTAPSVFNLGQFTEPALASLTAPNVMSVTFDNTDAWANATGAAMLLYTGRPVNGSVNFFKGPWRFAAAILGDTTTAPTSPAAAVAQYAYVAGQKCFMQVRVTEADGRLSSSFRDVVTVV